jgi:two-component system, OmpR family, sensor histidine kinase BaeS
MLFGFIKKFNSLRSRMFIWVLIIVVPILGLASLWLYLFLCFFYNHYVIIPLTRPPPPTMTLISQPLMQETLIAWVVLLAFICIYAFVFSLFANKRLQQILQRLDPQEAANNTARTANNDIELPADVLHVINSITTLNNTTQLKLNQYQQINADMTHELRSPLHTIGFAIESIREGLIAPTPQMFAILYNEVQRIHRLVEDMRTLSLIDIHKFPLYCKPTNFHEIVMHVVTTKNILAQQHNLQIIVTEPPLTIIDIDADRIMQVIANILDNAIRHSPDGANITLEYLIHTDSVVLTIRDTGTGIAPDDIPHLFTRFYRGTTPKGQGSGLGLAIAHAIITAHGGTITIDSILGQGTTVTIQLPRV